MSASGRPARYFSSSQGSPGSVTHRDGLGDRAFGRGGAGISALRIARWAVLVLLMAALGLSGAYAFGVEHGGRTVLSESRLQRPQDAPPEAESALSVPLLPRASEKIEARGTLRLRPKGILPSLSLYQPLPSTKDPALEQVVLQSLGDGKGRVALVVKDLADGKGVVVDAQRTFYAASLFKTWVMLEAFHQKEAGLLDWDEAYIVSEYYVATYRVNESDLQGGDFVTLGEALQAMILWSDNVAAGLLLERVGLT